jgi:3-methylcrotonyl-CoA carboxylase alpha subunit
VQAGSDVSVHYDPMLAKLIVNGSTREVARRRAIMALREYAILGIRTNIPFLLQILEHPQFVKASIDTGFLDRESASLVASIPRELPAAVLAAVQQHRAGARTSVTSSTMGTSGTQDPFETLRGWRG